MDPKDQHRQDVEQMVTAILETRNGGQKVKFPLSEKKFMDVATDIVLGAFALGMNHHTGEMPTIEYVKTAIHKLLNPNNETEGPSDDQPSE